MGMAQQIPRVTPEMLRSLPNQFTDIINRLIDKVNELDNE